MTSYTSNNILRNFLCMHEVLRRRWYVHGDRSHSSSFYSRTGKIVYTIKCHM